MDLFDHARERTLETRAPLAARMRPRTLDEYVGQCHVLGPGRLLRRAIQADQLSSLIFHGPPGTGKTTLARIIANTTQAHFSALNAVLSGVADIRAAVADAQTRLGEHGRRTILFVDEVHRFNKSQQDALLPHVENGTVILIGATTENPYFEVNKPLVSRSRIFSLTPLTEAEVAEVLLRAVADPERGYGQRQVVLEKEALAHLARVANGDARAALNALELAVETTPPGEDGTARIDLGVAEESIQRKAVLYDKEGDAHFDAISAFIKSLRGSDPDAALYWMARMVYAGEDPRFILRRMLIFAAEDIGLADPNALQVAASAAQAFDYVGLPEGRFHLAEACLYLATAPKSNSAFAFFDALASVEADKAEDVPDHLKDANRDAEGFGHGQGYLYPHSYREHWVAQQYLPEGLQGRVFYEPSGMGYEGSVQLRVQQNREAALAAWREGPGLPVLFSAGAEGSLDESHEAAWLARGQGTLAEHLGRVRDAVFALAEIRREHLVLDANAGAGLLTFEAVRLAAEGGVWARVGHPSEAKALGDGMRLLPALSAPVVLTGALASLPGMIEARESPEARFDVVLARNLVGPAEDRSEALSLLAGVLAPGGRLVVAEGMPKLGERLLGGLDWQGLEPELAARVLAAEEAIYSDPEHPLSQWDPDSLEACATQAGLEKIGGTLLRDVVEFTLGSGTLRRWFDKPGGGKGPVSGGMISDGRLGELLGEDAGTVQRHLERTLSQTPVRRAVAVALFAFRKPQ